MSFYRAKWRINGHRVGSLYRNGRDGYCVIFERCYEENTLENIEGIDWTRVRIDPISEDTAKCDLPDGYAFTAEDIQYSKSTDAFVVMLKVDKQYWGDVTPYQAQIAELTAASEAKDSELSEKNALIAEKAQQIAQKDSKIAEMADAEQAAKILLGEAD